MPDIVKESCDTEQFLNECGRRAIGEDGPEGRVEMLGKATGDVHRPQGMLKAAVFGRWEDPAGRLELGDPTEALDPGGVN